MKKILSIISIVLIIGAFIFLYENKDLGYELYGETENFKYENIFFLRDNGTYYIIFGNPKIKNSKITEENITRVALICDDRLIVASDTFLSGISTERKGYDELFSKEVVQGINNWHYEITYNINGEDHTDIIKLKNDII